MNAGRQMRSGIMLKEQLKVDQLIAGRFHFQAKMEIHYQSDCFYSNTKCMLYTI